jgi:mannose-6-phosphate isomerase-like protein (cupin superfamily)
VSGNDGGRPRVVAADSDQVWFLGTVARIKLDGGDSGGRLGLVEVVLPRGASPPLHSHPQDETFYVLDGGLTVWLVEPELARDTGEPPGWVASAGRRLGPGAVAFAPGGMPHTFRVESGTARVLVISTPAGIEEMMRALSEPAQWPWLPPPADGPRVPPERIAEVEQQVGMIRHGPPPPPS